VSARGYAGLAAGVGVLAAVIGHLLRDRLPPGAAAGFALGGVLAAVGAVSWILAAERGRRRPGSFMLLVGLGILGRLVVYGATLIYVALLTRIDPLWTAGSLLGFHVLLMMLEVRFALHGMKGPGAKEEVS
jgi:hypothetical protein